MKKVSEGGVVSDGENPSEEDQLKWALEQSLNTNSDSKNDFNATSDQIKCDGDVSKLSEEDQLKLALGKLMLYVWLLTFLRRMFENLSERWSV